MNADMPDDNLTTTSPDPDPWPAVPTPPDTSWPPF